jgi:hypothetical protein
MPVNAYIKGSNGTPLKINGEGEASVVVHPHPPKDESVAPLPFRQYFTDNGFSSGDERMNVNGSTTSQDFSIAALQDFDIYVKSISVVIGDGGTPALNKFGSLSALTTGIEWIYFNQDEADYQLHNAIKTNLEFIRLGVDTGAIGSGTDAYLADVSGGGTEKSYIPTIDMSETFGLQWGIRLRKGTTDKLIFRIKDDLTGVTTFNAIAYGIRF